MFSASHVLTPDRYRLFLPLPLTSVNSVPSALRSTFNSTTPLTSAGHPPQATIPFRITSFAHPHHLTSIESYLCKNEGRGWYPAPPPNPFLFFPQRVNIPHTATPVYPEQGRGASPLFSCVYSTFPVTPGVGWDSQSWLSASRLLDLRLTAHVPRDTCHAFSARLRELCVSALSFPSLFLSTLNCRLSTFPPRPLPSHESPVTASRTSTLPPPNYGIIPPHRGVSSSSLTTGRNPIRKRGGFSD
jgi:hypothetical protein